MPPILALPASQSESDASLPSTPIHLSTASFAIPGGPINAVQPVMRSMSGQPSSRAVGIHYKGGGEATTSLLGSQVQFACNNLTSFFAHLKSGTLRALMVTTPQRLVDLPDVPTSRELGWPDMERITGWTALMGPPGMAKEAVDKWIGVLGKLASDPDWLAGNARIGGIPAIRSPAETENFVRDQYELYKRLATSLNIRE